MRKLKKILAKISDIEKRKITGKKINKIKFGSSKKPTILKTVTLTNTLTQLLYSGMKRGNNYNFKEIKRFTWKY